MFTWKQSDREQRSGALHRARAGWGGAPSGRERKQSRIISPKGESLLSKGESGGGRVLRSQEGDFKLDDRLNQVTNFFFQPLWL